RRVGLGGAPDAAAGDDLPPAVVPAERLRLRVLGPPDHRAAHDRRLVATGAPAPVHPGRAARRSGSAAAVDAVDGRGPVPGARPGAGPLRPPAVPIAAARRAGGGRTLDRRPPGSRRLVGWDPAAVGVLPPRPLGARLST